MYNHMDDKQSILNDLQMMNFFGDSTEETTNKHNNFQIKLFKQLKYNFPKLMTNISLDDMDYIITNFNLSDQNYITKNNIKKLIQFLKIHDTIKQQEKKEFEQTIENIYINNKNKILMMKYRMQLIFSTKLQITLQIMILLLIIKIIHKIFPMLLIFHNQIEIKK